jgi:hypothetical protein
MAPKVFQPSNLSISLACVRTFIAKYFVFLGVALAYLSLVRWLRYKRTNSIASPFADGKRPLSSMTTQEAFEIMTQLQSLEFPYAMNKARSVALLKVCGSTLTLVVLSLTWLCRLAEYPRCQSCSPSRVRITSEMQEGALLIRRFFCASHRRSHGILSATWMLLHE